MFATPARGVGFLYGLARVEVEAVAVYLAAGWRQGMKGRVRVGILRVMGMLRGVGWGGLYRMGWRRNLIPRYSLISLLMIYLPTARNAEGPPP